MNTLQEWYLINPSTDTSHPIHIHVNSFQVCKHNVCWSITIFYHNLGKNEKRKSSAYFKWSFIDLGLTTLWIVHESAKLLQILHMVWNCLAPSYSLFPVQNQNLLKVKYLGSVMYDEIRWKLNLKISCCFTAATKILDEYWPDFWQTSLIKQLISQWCAIKYSSKNVLRAYVAAKFRTDF